MTLKEITFDSNYLYVDQEKFFPILHEFESCSDSLESVNGVMICVDCADSSGFVWEEARLLAEKAVELGKWILWKLDFQFQDNKVFVEDSASFYAKVIAIEEFIKSLWTPFQESTIGACLFRGGVDFAKYFVWTEQHERLYLEKNIENLEDLELEEIRRKLFAADIFSEYLQRLASFLPENVLPFCLLDVSSLESNAVLSFLLSRERFQHLILGLKKSQLPLGCLNWEEGNCLGGWIGRRSPYFSALHDVTLGVCIPLESNMTKDLLVQLDALFDELNRMEVSYRVVSELYLNESWDGIDDLIVFGSVITSQGERMLRGFLAAGGRVIYADSPVGLDAEISLIEFSKV
jgi:hypothetical protein